MKSILTPIAAMLALSACAAPSKPPVHLGVASFNMAWAGTEVDYQAHLQVCTAASWCDTRPERKKGEKSPTPEAIAKAKRCEADIEKAAGGPAKAMQIAPCNAYKTGDPAQHETAANYAAKMAGLRDTVANLIENEGVQVIAFQEVKSQAAVVEVLGRYASSFDTCAAPHTTFQTVAFAWDKRAGTRPGTCAVRTELAISEDPNDKSSLRTVRPGLALALDVNGETVTFMNIHLKSSCANLHDSARYRGYKLTDGNGACRVLNRQVPALEHWIEAVDAASPRFVLLGDYNRRIDEEAAAPVASGLVRADGSDPAGPHKPDAQGYVTTQYLWQEIADGKPALHLVPAPLAAPGCAGFDGLDHIVLSGALRALQDATTFASRKTAVVARPDQKIETSDHCPTVLKLKL